MRVGPLGIPELLIIFAIILLIFGARKLPEIGSSLGKWYPHFQNRRDRRGRRAGGRTPRLTNPLPTDTRT